ncbi:diadenylate cyclase CdaA [Enterococcus sp. LJL120]
MSFQISDLLSLTYWQDLFSGNILTLSFWINILDILVVWFLAYKLIELVRGTKAVQLIRGVALFILIRILAEFIGLHTLSWLMNHVITYGVIAAVVIFQPEVRRGLEHLGRQTFFTQTKKSEREEERVISAYDKAIQYMGRRKIGALISIERNTGLDEYIETGIPLDADISGELLINIFIPNTPLHDGAVIVKKNKIAVASAYLPLSESMLIPKEYGTRHRAAIGLSEVSDALTIIVSEETGHVSMAVNNEFLTDLSQEEYLVVLHQYLTTEEETTNIQGLRGFFNDFFKSGGKRK